MELFQYIALSALVVVLLNFFRLFCEHKTHLNSAFAELNGILNILKEDFDNVQVTLARLLPKGKK